MPDDSAARASLIRLPLAHYAPDKSAIDAALAELLPVLSAEYDAAFKSRAHRAALAKLASDVAHAKNKSDTRDDKSFTATPRPARIAPSKAPRYAGNGKVDMQARRDAIERDKPSTPLPAAVARVRRQGLLSDGASVGRK